VVAGATKTLKAVTTAIKDTVNSLKPKTASASTSADAPAS